MSQFLSLEPVWLTPLAPAQELDGRKVRVINKCESWLATFRMAEQHPLSSGPAKIAISVWQSWVNTPSEWQSVTSGLNKPAPLVENGQWESWLTEDAVARIKPAPDELGFDFILDLRD